MDRRAVLHETWGCTGKATSAEALEDSFRGSGWKATDAAESRSINIHDATLALANRTTYIQPRYACGDDRRSVAAAEMQRVPFVTKN